MLPHRQISIDRLKYDSDTAQYADAAHVNAQLLIAETNLALNDAVENLSEQIEESSNKTIESNQRLAKSNNFQAWTMIALTTALVIVGVLQVVAAFKS